ncbi:MAG: RNA polymerase sigma factor [Nocardioidaceae bacterium]
MPEDVLLGHETLDHALDAIDGLPEAQRLVITLRDVYGWTADEVCNALDVSNGNQRVLLHRARSRVRTALERHFDD